MATGRVQAVKPQREWLVVQRFKRSYSLAPVLPLIPSGSSWSVFFMPQKNGICNTLSFFSIPRAVLVYLGVGLHVRRN